MWWDGSWVRSVELLRRGRAGWSTYPRRGGVVSVVTPAPGQPFAVWTWMSPSPPFCGSSRKTYVAIQTMRCSGTRPADTSIARNRWYGPSGVGPVPCVRSIQRSTLKTPFSVWPHIVMTIPATGPPDGHQLGTVAVRLETGSVTVNVVWV